MPFLPHPLRPRRAPGRSPLSPPHPPEQLYQPSLRLWGKMRLAPQVHDLLIDLGLRRIGMDRGGDRLCSGTGFHRNGKLTDHVAGMGRNNRGPDNLVRALLNVDSREPFVLAVEDRTINLIELICVGLDLDEIGRASCRERVYSSV